MPKYFVLKFPLAEEESWSERNETKNVTEEALKSDISDGDEATKDSNTEERNKMAEEEDQNMADTNVKDAEDTESLRKSTDRRDVEDVAGCAVLPLACYCHPPQLYDLILAYLRPFTINLYQTPWTSNIYMLIRSQF
ncbi:hypothetical protein KGM_203798 [Danaus plexippus plexippus]|uniref:Uncharacterized protein n=1 Tax=Danaus plexippus plexippus TaxID=278856 RepID=A0A212ET67_DANPL|nr:hypothetical protein KGM_203798 [Danaus plexippus plexippus]